MNFYPNLLNGSSVVSVLLLQPACTTSPLLLVSAPIGLQFNGLTNGAIAAQSSFLNVQAGQTLALVGGDVTLQGANLFAESGRIELGSVAGNGFVAIAPTANGFALNYNQVPNFGNLRLEQETIADTSGINGGGNIQVQGKQVTLDGGSALLSLSLGNGNGNEVFVRATEVFAARGDINIPMPSGIYADTGLNSSGNGSNVTIAAKRVEFTNGGQVFAGTLGSGNGGEIRVNASDIRFVGVSSLAGFSGLFSPVFEKNTTGNGGNIIVTTDNLLVDEYGWILSDTFGKGNAGNIDITAKNINLITNDNSSGEFALITSGVFPDATGHGGVLKITTDNLQLTGASLLSASTDGFGNGGTIDITAKSIILDGSNADIAADIFNGTLGDGTGNGGDLKITADSIVLKNGGQISVDVSNISGNAGNLLINAKSIDIFGQNNSFRSGIFANAFGGEGNGGNIEVNSDRLIVRDGGVSLQATLEIN